jgi:hypothetical protein
MGGAVVSSVPPLSAPIKYISGSVYTVTEFDGTLLVTTGNSNTTINLNFANPTGAQQWVQYTLNGVIVTSYITKILNIKKVDSGTGYVVLQPPSPSTSRIDGALNYSFNTQYQSITVQWDGSNWFII